MKHLTLAMILSAACLSGTAFAEVPPSTTQEAPKASAEPIEVCFVVDTTGSMSSLIEGAKLKIWSIANEVVKANPKRPLKISLVPYRDRGDEYVTKVIDLNDDLDAMYKQLLGFQANGGGDGPESVNQALQDAVEKVSWSKGPGTRLIFLVGDSPPHMDYKDDVKYPVTLEKAVKANLIVNTVQCGSVAGTDAIWKEIAQKGEGTYLALSQTGNMTAISAPQDKKIAALNADLAKTVIPYGAQKQQAEVAAKVTLSGTMAPEAAAARASVNAKSGGRAVQGAGDLVNDVKGDKDLVGKLKEESLPENMKKMTAEERKKHVEEQLAKRKTINEELAKVTEERDAYIKAENEKLSKKGDSFDVKVGEVIREQAARKK